ncbi:unnamed protein product [Didymodactylos carnosus]|uniref:GTP cyclohydrolase 1 feedback regulatory protein n=1 Tax=Didymodactylos carnosus TaxID=1234261 RepID=A0A815XG63_9BILA|nr:unnamed protein product [Didymodactylos carnosus]CAF4418453.1 unnamed protein product [Didymodactylos carnosus]
MLLIMPHLLISTKIRLEPGPTIVGDERTDPEIMDYLDATLFHEKGNNFSEYRTSDCARIVLDKLEKIGYRAVAMTGIGQTCIWLLHKEVGDNETRLVGDNGTRLVGDNGVEIENGKS